MSKLTIIDMFNNVITVTDLKAAIDQAAGGIGVQFKTAPFEIVDGNSREIEGREEELIPLGDYWEDTHTKLVELQEAFIKLSADIVDGYEVLDIDKLNREMLVLTPKGEQEVFKFDFGPAGVQKPDHDKWVTETVFKSLGCAVTKVDDFIKNKVKSSNPPAEEK